MNLPFPQVPVLFFKPSTSLADPSDLIPIPKTCQNDQMDYEVELAIIIGKEGCRDVPEDKALEYVLGWSCGNDLTARKHQVTSSQWGYAKGAFLDDQSSSISLLFSSFSWRLDKQITYGRLD